MTNLSASNKVALSDLFQTKCLAELKMVEALSISMYRERAVAYKTP